MKSSRELVRGRGVWSLVGGVALAAGLTACGGGGEGDEENEPPTVSEALVTCVYNAELETYVWDFYALVDDANGYDDVTGVTVEAYNVGEEPVLESYQLTAGDNGEWAGTVREGSEGEGFTEVLDCENKEGFEFGFWATDSAGERDGVLWDWSLARPARR